MMMQIMVLATTIYFGAFFLIVATAARACAWNTYLSPPSFLYQPPRRKVPGNSIVDRRCRSSCRNNLSAINPLSMTTNNSDAEKEEVIFSRESSRRMDDRVTKAVSSRSSSSSSTRISPLSCNIQELSVILKGTGRARAVWDCYRNGIDPLLDDHDHNVFDKVRLSNDDDCEGESTSSGMNNRIGAKSRALLERHFGKTRTIDHIAKVIKTTVSSDGTTKLLLELSNNNDGNDDDDGDDDENIDRYTIETVIIPWEKRQRSTICVSSQVGCQQACSFCATGRMGKLRSLTSDEILVQIFHANALINELSSESKLESKSSMTLYPIDNVVFMGMGEPADNVDHVVRAANILTDPCCFAFAPRRVTISTVAPTPQAFQDLIGHGSLSSSAVLAWSVHSSRDEIRKQLVPTTRYPMIEFREKLIETLAQRSRRQRAIMLEITLLHGINDSVDDAVHLAEFCQPLLERVPGIKLVVNVIPWNDIDALFGPASRYQKPSMERVLAFQNVLVQQYNMLCYIRTTRGDDESAACGQLATKASSTTSMTKTTRTAIA